MGQMVGTYQMLTRVHLRNGSSLGPVVHALAWTTGSLLLKVVRVSVMQTLRESDGTLGESDRTLGESDRSLRAGWILTTKEDTFLQIRVSDLKSGRPTK